MNVAEIEVEALADGHFHGREGVVTGPLIQYAIAGGADILGLQPNTTAGLTTAEQVVSYIGETRLLVRPDQTMHFLPFVMITEGTTPEQIDACVAAGIRDGKIYPRHRTTKSENGVVRYGSILPIVRHCGRVGMRVHFHPEHPEGIFCNRDAEFVFLPLAWMFLQETNATIIWEHGTDARCIPHWKKMAETGRSFVTLTPHHLAANEDEAFGDVRLICKPPIKTEADRQALVDLVSRNHPWVMAGSDCAFHDKSAKQVNASRCACGVFMAPFTLALYAHALDHLLVAEAGLQTFVNFTSRNARRLHNLPPSSRTIKLVRETWQVPPYYPVGQQDAPPFAAGQTISWRMGG